MAKKKARSKTRKVRKKKAAPARKKTRRVGTGSTGPRLR